MAAASLMATWFMTRQPDKKIQLGLRSHRNWGRRRLLPAGHRARSTTWDATTRRPLPPRPRRPLQKDGHAGPGALRDLRRRRPVPRHGYDLMAEPRRGLSAGRWLGSPTRMVVFIRLQAEDDLSVVVQDLVGVLRGQAGFSDVVERLRVRLERHQDRVVAPRHEVVGAE